MLPTIAIMVLLPDLSFSTCTQRRGAVSPSPHSSSALEEEGLHGGAPHRLELVVHRSEHPPHAKHAVLLRRAGSDQAAGEKVCSRLWGPLARREARQGLTMPSSTVFWLSTSFLMPCVSCMRAEGGVGALSGCAVCMPCMRMHLPYPVQPPRSEHASGHTHRLEQPHSIREGVHAAVVLSLQRLHIHLGSAARSASHVGGRASNAARMISIQCLDSPPGRFQCSAAELVT